MMMSDAEITLALINKTLIIKNWDKKAQLQSASIDLRLSSDILRMPHDKVIDPLQDEIEYNPVITVTEGMPITIQPHEFLLASTIERIHLNGDITGICTGRSSIGRLGLTIHATAGYIDPGFEGTLTLELCNLTDNTILLYPGQRICQLLLFKTGHVNHPYNEKYNSGKYMGQTMPTPSRIMEDKKL